MKKTEDIIERLAADLRPVPAFALERRLAFAALPALGVSLLLMFIILGPRGDMRDAVSEPAFWVKSFYNALLAMVAFRGQASCPAGGRKKLPVCRDRGDRFGNGGDGLRATGICPA